MACERVPGFRPHRTARTTFQSPTTRATGENSLANSRAILPEKALKNPRKPLVFIGNVGNFKAAPAPDHRSPGLAFAYAPTWATLVHLQPPGTMPSRAIAARTRPSKVTAAPGGRLHRCAAAGHYTICTFRSATSVNGFPQHSMHASPRPSLGPRFTIITRSSFCFINGHT